ncbi:hypothetical protein PROFUN_11844, partial [Planoprotostelium fungivorum]
LPPLKPLIYYRATALQKDCKKCVVLFVDYSFSEVFLVQFSICFWLFKIERGNDGLVQQDWSTAQGPITGVTRPDKASEQPAQPLELPNCEPKTRSKT